MNNVSNVQELINALQQIEDKTLPIRFVNQSDVDNENVWLNGLECSERGQSGFEVDGEIRLIGNY